MHTSLPRARIAVCLCSTLLIVVLNTPVCAVAQQSYDYRWSLFTCESEFPLDDPDELGRDLELVRTELMSVTGVELSDEQVHLSLFANRKRYTTFVSLETGDARRQRGVFINRDGQSQVYSFQQDQLAATLRHESTHALLHSALPYVPLWLDEGLASYFEASAGEQGANHSNLKKLQWSLRV
ncbi:MAG: DUF1570 domain-containing protein, partial [Pirellulales bacterium]